MVLWACFSLFSLRPSCCHQWTCTALQLGPTSFHVSRPRLTVTHNRLSATRPLVADEPTEEEQEEGESDYSCFSTQSFRELYHRHFPKWLLDKCSSCGWEYPTIVQEQTLDAILMENATDIVVQAQTGSGKTLAFLLPCLAGIDPTRSAVQALIVVPTRELGLQVAKVAKRLAGSDLEFGKKIMVMSVLQGSKNRRQRAWAWVEPPHIVIGTPVELCNMIRFGGIKRYNSIKFLVVDEVDACLLNNGGKTLSQLILSSSTPLHELLSKYLSPSYNDGLGVERDMELSSNTIASSLSTKPPRPVQNERLTIFCSATIPQIRHFLKQCVQNQWMLQSPRHISVDPGYLPVQIRHGFVVCDETALKLQTLRRLIRKIDMSTFVESESSTPPLPKKVLIFAEPYRPLENMAKVVARDIDGGFFWNEHTAKDELELDLIRVSVLRFEDSLSQRATALDGFREAPRGAILFTTDLAARGLDVPDISHVVHFDLADSSDTYIHRSGRTARLGKSGQVLNIVTAKQEFVLERIANALQVEMSCVGRQGRRRQKSE